MKDEGRPALPAPYEPPWRRLGADLQAVAAGAGLKLRELARLNREGALPRPEFWPLPLAPWFWPLLLALVLAVPLALAWGGAAWLRSPRAAVPGVAASGVAVPALPGPALPGAGRSVPFRSGPFLRPGAEGSVPPGVAGEEAPGAEGDSQPVEESSTQLGADGPALPPAPTTPPPLLTELLGPEPPAWVLALEEEPAAGLVRLRLAEGFGRLPEARRRSLAEGWLLRAQELGYGQLELVGEGGGLLARPARVGSGMILLDPPASPP